MTLRRYAVVRDGELTPEQREHLVTLLHLIDTAAALGPRAGERYPDNPEQAAVYTAAAWEPVRRVHPAPRCGLPRWGALGGRHPSPLAVCSVIPLPVIMAFRW